MAGFLGSLAVWFYYFIAIVTSTPINDSPRTASLPAADGIFRGRNHGPSEYHRTLSKYNIPIPKALEAAVARYAKKFPADQTGGVPAVPQDGDVLYIAPAGIGSPPQVMYLDFDTGSSDTWVFSSDTEPTDVNGQALYDPSKSSTSELIPNCTWDILYGDFSSSSGIVYKDTFTIGQVSIPGMTVESAKRVSNQFTKQKNMSGLAGLAFSSLIQTIPPQQSLVDFLAEVLKEPLFTTDLRHNSSEGSYNFGYIDDSLHSSDIEYIGIDKSQGFWGATMKAFAVKGDTFQYEFASPPSIIIDTGSTLFYAPDAAVKQYFKSVPGANFSQVEYGWIIPCNSTPPNFIWELGDGNNTIMGEVAGEYFVYSVLDDGLSPPGYCYAGLQSLGNFGTPQGIFGDVFLKSGFQVFDVGNTRFGHAPKPLPGLNTNSQEHLKSYFKRQKPVVLG